MLKKMNGLISTSKAAYMASFLPFYIEEDFSCLLLIIANKDTPI